MPSDISNLTLTESTPLNTISLLLVEDFMRVLLSFVNLKNSLNTIEYRYLQCQV